MRKLNSTVGQANRTTCQAAVVRAGEKRSRTMLSPKARLALSAAALAGAAMVRPDLAHAANATWGASPATSFWNDVNWTSGGAAYTPLANDVLVFGTSSTTGLQNDFSSGTQFNGLTFLGGASAFTLNGNGISLGGAVSDQATGTETINLPIALTATQSFDVANGGTLVLGGVVSGTSFGITKTGLGTMVLTSNNTYTGPTTIQGGGALLLDFNAAGATSVINSGNTVTLGGGSFGGGTLSMNGAAAGSTQSLGGVTLNGILNGISVTSNTGAANLNLGTITRNSGTYVNITLPANGSVTTTRANANFAGGQNTILGGWATVGNTWAVSASDGTTPGAITGLADASYVASTNAWVAGTVGGKDVDIFRTGNSTTPATATTVNSLRWANTANGTVTISAPLTVASGGILFAGTSDGTFTAANSTNTLTSGNGQDLVFINNSGGRTLNLAAKITGNNGLTFVGMGAGPGQGGQFRLDQVGAGATQGQNNDFVGNISIVNSRLEIGTFDGEMGAAANTVTVVGGMTGGGQFWNNSNLTTNRAITASGLGWAESGGAFGAIRNRGTLSGTITIPTTTRFGTNSTGTFSGKITGPGQLWLDFSGSSGSIVLTNSGNDFSGGMRIERGTVFTRNSGGSIPANSTLTFGTSIQSGTLTPQGSLIPTLDIGTRSISVSSATVEPGDAIAAGSPTTAGASITSASATAGTTGTVTFNTVSNTTTVPITGFINVVKNGPGNTLTLSQLGTSSNTYAGQTIINAGTLATIYPIDKSSAITVASIGTLDVASLPGGMIMPNSQTLTNAGAVYGNITNNGSGLITNSGVINGNLTVSGSANVTNSNTINGNVSLNGGTFTHTGTINGSGTLNGGTLSGGNAAFTNGLTLSNMTVTPVSGAVGTFSAATLSASSITYNVDIDDATSDRLQITNGATLTGTSTINLTLLNPPSTSPSFYDVLTAGSAFTGGGTFTLSNTQIGRTVFSIDGTAPSNVVRIKAVGNAASLVWNNTAPATGDGVNWDVQGQQNFLNTGTGLPDQFFQKDDVTFNDNNNGHYAVTVGTVNPGSVVVNNSLGDYTFTGGNIGSNAELTKSGTSALTIDGNHSYTGNTTLNDGTLNVKQNNALGTGTLIINGGKLDNTSGGVATLSNSAMVINANVNYVGTASLSLNTATAPVTLNTNADINVGTNTLFLNGGIRNGTGNSITKSGSGTLVLSGSSTYTGTTIVNSGQLVVGGAGDGTTFSALGAPTGGDATITTGSTMNLSSTGNINLGQKLIHISGTGLPDGNGGSFGVITNRDLNDYNSGGPTQQLNALQRVILEGDASIGSPGNGPDNATNLGRFDIRAAQVGGVNVAELDLNGHNLTKIGGSFMSLVATDVNGTGNIILKDQGSALGMETTTKILDDGGTSKILAGNGTRVQWWNLGASGATNLTRRVELGDGGSGDETTIANGGGVSTVGMPLLFKSNVTIKPTYANFNNNDFVLLGNLTEDSTPRKLTKANSGSVTLSGNNSFTGGLNINPGPNPSGGATSGTGVVIMGSSTALHPLNTVAFNPSSTSWNAILRLNGFNTTVNGLDAGGTSSFVENVSVNAATLTANLTTNDYTFNGLLRDGTGGGTLNFVKSGDNHRQTLAGANTYTGTTTVTGGTLEIGNGGSGSIPGTSLITSATSSGTIVFHRDTPQTIPNVLDGTVNMHHQDGTVTLSGNSTTTGTIELGGSVLAITGSTTSAKVVVNGGTLAGTGNAGNLTLNNNATVQPGPASLADGSVGTLTLNSFTGNDGTFRLDLNTLAGNDRVTVTNVASFTADHTTTFTPVFAAIPTTTGSITLLTAGTLQIDPNAHFNATAPSGSSRLAYHVAPVGNSINLIIDSAIGELVWTGNSDHTTWDVNNHQNWKLGGSPAVYLEADKVTFDGTSSDRTITLDTTVQPTLVTVNSVEYTLNGGGGFGGDNGFTKAGDGTLTLNNTGSNFSGGLNVTNGAIKLGASNAIPNNVSLVLGDAIANTSGVVDLHGFSATVTSLASAGTGTAHAITNSGSSTATLTVNSSTASTIFNGSIQDGTGTTALNFTGGTLAVNGNHTFSGGATINSGTLITSSALGTGSILNNGNLVFASANAMNVGTLSGNGALLADGGGTLQLVGADNTTGPVIIGAPSATPFSNTPTSINATNANVTATGLQVRVNNAAASTITIGSGKTLTVNGAVVIGPNVNNLTTGVDSTGVSTLVKMDGGGNFVNNVTSENFLVGQFRNNADPGTDPNATLDLSGLSNFTFDAGTGGTGEMRIGYGGNIVGTLSLANSSTGGNLIRGAALRVGDSNNGNNGGASRLLLGAGTNVINVNTATIGSGKSAGSIAFLGDGGSVTIAAQNGTDPANIFIGNATSASASTTDSIFSLAGHLANINAGSVIIGRVGGATTNTGNGSVTFDTGLFNAGTIQLAVHSSGTATTQGLLTLGGPVPNNTATGVLNVTNQFLLVNRTVTAGSTATGVFTMNGGTANINTDILIVDSATSGTRSTTITLAGGNLNMMGHAIATSALPVNNVNMPATGQTATLSNLGGTGINGTGLKMNGAGTLQLDGNNSYAGTTSVQSGRLVTLSDNARSPIFSGGGADITGGRLMFDYNASGSTDPVSLVKSTLTAGFNQSPTKFATGALRTSSPADPNKGLGWADNTTAKQLSVLYTWYGDANLDGTVNALDFNALATNYGSNNGSQVWANGDYNYDGNINSLDFGVLAANFNKQMPVPAPVLGDVAVTALGSLVPEPSSMALLLGAGLALARRARRRR